MTEMKIFIDGKWVSRKSAKISVFDHGVLYGDGVFEGIRAYGGRVFRLNAHLSRLQRSAALTSLVIPLTAAKLEKLIYEGLKRNRLQDAYIRLLVTRGEGDLGLDPRCCPKPNVIIIIDKLALFPEKCYREGLQAVIAQTRRTNPDALDPTIKSMNYLNNILAKIEANRQGVPEAIMLNAKGYVCECTGDNVFYVKDRVVVTPPVSAGILEGITRAAVIEIIRKKTSFAIKESLFTPQELFSADEVFFTGTAAEIIPVTLINKRPIGTGAPGAVTQELVGHFKQLIKSEASSTQPASPQRRGSIGLRLS